MLKKVCIYTLLIVAIFLPWFAWETDRNMVREWLYPAQGISTALSTHCNNSNSRWLQNKIKTVAIEYTSPANQVALLSPNGVVTECHNGWLASPLFSTRIQTDTAMRMASLSKAITFTSLMHGSTAIDPQRSQAWLSSTLSTILATDTDYADARVQEIRITNLLNHSAGFDRLVATDPMFQHATRPWCPYAPEHLAQITLQFDPGSRHAYGNINYCLAVLAYEAFFDEKFEDALNKIQWKTYGLGFIREADSPVHYNFMHQDFYGPDFPKYFDWYALRSSMGMTGNAAGIARFMHDHRAILQQAMQMPSVAGCDATKPLQCFNGFWERREIDGKTIWLQSGYLFGMGAIMMMDSQGNGLVWLGAGEARNPSSVTEYWLKTFANLQDELGH